MKNIQIPQKLLIDLVYYFFVKKDENTEERIKTALNSKLDALARHQLYTESKTAATPEEKEQARQAYLDRIGIPDSFRWGEKEDE